MDHRVRRRAVDAEPLSTGGGSEPETSTGAANDAEPDSTSDRAAQITAEGHTGRGRAPRVPWGGQAVANGQAELPPATLAPAQIV